ncbi:acyl-CoA carboxylase alpha chain [Gordonia polyisoprenivorans NBRC 16320 = JCM 10675]|uniref:Biotin-dependent 3-methylcrotonyl-coenzyme A carboxylase alpha1 subunit n=1 Tax=Gordonia polyisoprenivorans TaxID=84595 RepID=A0A846WWC0_9ACTN|nr:biotin carboxylase N-terminal domain-containing protein [Gordonia polyisoprenivorans]NKY05196.1 ATP-grasp domain-containing protein [Gordonia polyisoprenivorans]GAB24067.1 acyl-CoA carboxylase alpha chain [Gordonia polyisoprenivorans NBRC 16320 = JCM 10675]
MIKKILVANRGEIARRVFRTCREMGIATVGVYSDADADALFVDEADEAVPLGGVTPADSYLRADRVLEAARLTGADAVHPGYGFLSENARFAEQCATAGITFIGPGVKAIELMGSKLTARELMERAGVPVLPGRDLTGVDDADVDELADAVGWPILVKASFGGGGRGMRIVRDRDDLAEAIASARREAGSAFGDDTVFLEHYVDNPRHVEIQIFGDTHGTIVHLNERECSIQRRHQKILEESPSPAVDSELREKMGRAAVEAGRTLDYVGAGTVEFLLAPDGGFYFLEVNTRLQVEHPVTELVTGLDLVRLQIDVAGGAPLDPAAVSATISGHAIEARIYAEDAGNDFLPAAGRLDLFEIARTPGIRVDTGVRSGDVVSTNYDPMLAKVIAHGATRQEATARLAYALTRSRILGVTTNRALLVGILADAEFAAGAIDTHFLDRADIGALIGRPGDPLIRAAALAAALADQATQRASAPVLGGITSGFRNNLSQLQTRGFGFGDEILTVAYHLGAQPRFEVDGVVLEAQLGSVTPDAVELLIDGVRRTFHVVLGHGRRLVTWAAGSVELTDVERFPSAESTLDPGSLVAPMPGTVSRIEVAVGDEVQQNTTVIVIEAMKMEHSIVATEDSVVTEIPVEVGQAVDTGQVLIVLESSAGDEQGTVGGAATTEMAEPVATEMAVQA